MKRWLLRYGNVPGQGDLLSVSYTQPYIPGLWDEENEMTSDELTMIEKHWAPLAGNDTNGPHTKTANTIVALLTRIKQLDYLMAAQLKNIKDLEEANERCIKANDKLTDQVATLNTEIDRLRDLAAASNTKPTKGAAK